MGARGPVPKRSEERIRRNKEYQDTDTVDMVGEVEIPELGFDDPHPIIVDFYESLKQSGQSRYYEPSDWQYARFTMHFADGLLKTHGRPSAQLLAAVNTALGDLLVSEGQRRRVRLEIEREKTAGQLVDISALFEERMKDATPS